MTTMQAVKPKAEPFEPLAHSPARAGERLGVSTRQVYVLIANGDLRSYKEGKRRLIPDSECRRLVARRLAESAS
jgi:excisionase family DNA binding protein